MTREEAIQILTETQVVYFAPKGKEKAQEALDMAIEALEREDKWLYELEHNIPSEPMSHEEAWAEIERDLISREDAINAFDENYVYYKKGIRYVLEKVPSAEPTVIRCKDCRWYKVGKNDVDSWQLCGHPCREYENVTDDDFCSRAEMGDINP